MEIKIMNNPQGIAVLKQLTDILDEFSINYALGGSLASSLYGKVRFTEDADITVEPFSSHADNLYELLRKDFYISKDAISNALSNSTSFNIIHLNSAFKIDIFIRKDSDFEKLIFTRTKKLKLINSIDKLFSVVSPEDIILRKILWYKDSGCVSEKQFSDVTGVLSVQKQTLDFNYLHTWAKKLSVNNILQKAVEQSKE